MTYAKLDRPRGRKRERKHVCGICGRDFATERGLSIHMSKAHNVANFERGERVIVHDEGEFITIEARVKRSLWEDIVRRAREIGVRPERALIDALTYYAAFGDLLYDPSYIA